MDEVREKIEALFGKVVGEGLASGCIAVRKDGAVIHAKMNAKGDVGAAADAAASLVKNTGAFGGGPVLVDAEMGSLAVLEAGPDALLVCSLKAGEGDLVKLMENANELAKILA